MADCFKIFKDRDARLSDILDQTILEGHRDGDVRIKTYQTVVSAFLA